MRKWNIVALAALSASSVMAQGPDNAPKGYLTAGFFFPSQQSGVNLDPGFVFSLGYTFSRNKSIDFGIETAGYGYPASDLAGNYTVGLNFVQLTVSTRPSSEKGIWFSLGVGSLLATVTDGFTTISDDSRRSFYSLAIGSNLTRTTFLRTRYQSAFDSQYNFGRQGLSAEFGYRF